MSAPTRPPKPEGGLLLRLDELVAAPGSGGAWRGAVAEELPRVTFDGPGPVNVLAPAERAARDQPQPGGAVASQHRRCLDVGRLGQLLGSCHGSDAGCAAAAIGRHA